MGLLWKSLRLIATSDCSLSLERCSRCGKVFLHCKCEDDDLKK